MRKRGMSDVFKYILVLIGGIALLIFFISFGLKGAKLIKNVNAIEMSETLNDYFNAMNPSENLVTNAEINSKIAMNFPECGYISVSTDGQNIENSARYSHIIFSPGVLSGNTNIWVREWKYPFRIANFFYLTPRNMKIYLVGNSNLVNELSCNVNNANPRQAAVSCPSNAIDERFNVEKITSADTNFIREHGNSMFVFFNSQAPVAGNAKVKSIKAENCEDKDDDDECKGIVNFGDRQMFFVGKAMLYGAIFSEDSKNYECGFEMAMERLKLVSGVYNEKRLMMTKLRPNCGRYSFSTSIDTSSLMSMHNTMKGLKESNNNLAGVECGKLF
ncbi:hypothetical protein J4231_03385 [Candidatus Woesearchaeota archaeon]|nr:hypothetical protein [Candidatus Woesearchaeota archaeon]